MRDIVQPLIYITLFVTFVIVLWVIAIPAVDRWERSNGYPYGKLCQMYGTCATGGE
jgi:hypothetical protein